LVGTYEQVEERPSENYLRAIGINIVIALRQAAKELELGQEQEKRAA